MLWGGDAKPNGAGHIPRRLCQCNNLGEVLFVSESGIKTPEDIQKLYDNGTNAVLIGETLMRAPDKKAILAQLRGGTTA